MVFGKGIRDEDDQSHSVVPKTIGEKFISPRRRGSFEFSTVCGRPLHITAKSTTLTSFAEATRKQIVAKEKVFAQPRAGAEC